MHKKQKRTLIILSVLAVSMVTLLLLSRLCPEFTTRVYTGKIFPIVTMPFRFICNLIPISLGEIVLFGGILLFFVSGIRRIVLAICKHTWKPLLQELYYVALFLLVVVILFPVMGGLNYSRQTFSQMAGYEVTDVSAEELESLCRYLGKMAAKERNFLPQNEQGVTQSPLTIPEILDCAQEGYDRIGQTYPWLSGDYGTPKIAMASDLMSYLRISGIYPYFVPEAIVNTNTPILSLPHTACHEMAHQRGIAREDEANFVGYLAAIHHSEGIFRYSGYLEAYRYGMDALYGMDSERWQAVYKTTHSGILRDLAYIYSVWEPYTTSDNVLGEISTNLNDLYLKGNAVEDGVQNYNRMVDLLIAYQKYHASQT